MGSTTVAVVLAAGQSIRLGRPKALVECGNETLISTQVRRLRSSGVECIIVTSPELLSAISEVLEDIHCRIIAPDDPSNRTGNLKIGMAAAGDVDNVLVVPVDRPGWSLPTLSRLLERGATCCPQKDGRGGHPLLINGEDIDKLANAGNEIPKPLRISFISVKLPVSTCQH